MKAWRRTTPAIARNPKVRLTRIEQKVQASKIPRPAMVLFADQDNTESFTKADDEFSKAPKEIKKILIVGTDYRVKH